MTSPVRAAIGAAPLLACALLAACGFETSFDQTRYRCGVQGACPTGFTCAGDVCAPAGEVADARPDAPPGVEVWSFDVAEDFASPAATRTSVDVASRGALEPSAYLTGGVVTGGSGTFTFSDPAATTWDQVVAGTPGSRLGVLRGIDVAFGYRAPAGVGILSTDNWTIRGEGEIFLDAGTWTFALEADDYGFLELSADGASFARVVNASWGNDGTGTFVAPAAGWYPLHVALCDTGGNASIRLRYSGPGVAGPVAVPRHRLRAGVGGTAGLVQYGWDDQRGKGDLSARIDATELAHIDWRSDGPGDLGLSNFDFFSVRWAGQLRIEAAGEYVFRYLSEDGQRLWIDGAKVLDRWDEVSHNQATAPIMLAVGWHDVVIDVSDTATTANALLTIESGPELAGRPLPLDRLRPVEARSVRFESGVDHTDIAIPEGGGRAELPITIAAPADARVLGVDLVIGFEHSRWNDLDIRVQPPTGAVIPIDVPSSGGRVFEHRTFAFPTPPAVAGVWRLLVNDNVAGTTGTVLDYAVTLHHASGEPPIATTASYDSGLRDLGGVAPAIDTIQWAARAPAGSTVTLRLRTCGEVSACAGQPWSDPLPDPGGSAPPFTPQRFLQWRAELTSNGDVTPSLESVYIEYRAGS